jgi:exosome complex RNA-binding protein Csl4
MNADTITANITPGTEVRVTTKDGSAVTGTFISVNTKGINVKVDGKTVSRGLARLSAVEIVANLVPDTADDLFAGYDDDATLTTTALAVIFGTNAKALRVGLRAAGLGVGKGRTYGLTPADVRPLADAIRTNIPA